MTFITILVSAGTSALVTLFLFLFQPWVKKAWATRYLRMKTDGVHGDGNNDHVNVKVENGSFFSVMAATVYITVQHKDTDLRESPQSDIETLHTPKSPGKPISGNCLCWNFRSPNAMNPIRLDIFSGESHDFCPFKIYRGRGVIEIPSEEGWSIDKKKSGMPQQTVRVSRAFLELKKYTGSFTVVSAETFSKHFAFELDPANVKVPLTLKPI